MYLSIFLMLICNDELRKPGDDYIRESKQRKSWQIVSATSRVSDERGKRLESSKEMFLIARATRLNRSVQLWNEVQWL